MALRIFAVGLFLIGMPLLALPQAGKWLDAQLNSASDSIPSFEHPLIAETPPVENEVATAPAPTSPARTPVAHSVQPPNPSEQPPSTDDLRGMLAQFGAQNIQFLGVSSDGLHHCSCELRLNAGVYARRFQSQGASLQEAVQQMTADIQTWRQSGAVNAVYRAQ